jgi:hypothetical protein
MKAPARFFVMLSLLVAPLAISGGSAQERELRTVRALIEDVRVRQAKRRGHGR